MKVQGLGNRLASIQNRWAVARIPPNASIIFASVVICFRDLNYKKRENFHFSQSRLDYKLSENKQGHNMIYLISHRSTSNIALQQGHNMIYLISHRSTSNIALQTIIWFLSFSLKTHNFLQIDAESRSLWTLLGNKKNSTYSLVTMFINFYVK